MLPGSGFKNKRSAELRIAESGEFETRGFQRGMYNEVASLLPDKESKERAVNTGVKLLIRKLECIERKHTLVLS